MTKQKNRVWIELEAPKDDAHAEQICALANGMLARLRMGDAKGGDGVFSWDDERKMYEFGGPMGSEGLADSGKWFSLDYLGRA